MDKLPQEQIDNLISQLQGHQQRLQQLKRQMKTLSEEAAVHEKLVQMGQDQSILSVLGSLYNRPELATEAAQNPATFASKRHINLPEGVTVVVVDAKPESLKIDADFAVGPHRLKVRWIRDRGFLLGAANES